MRKLLFCFLAASAVSSTLLAGCSSTSSTVVESRVADPAEALIGQWHDRDLTDYTFERVDGRVTLVSIVDYDEEVFEVRSAGFVKGFYTIEYFVPSTSYVVTYTIQSLEGEQLPARWTNSEGESGEEAFTRFE